MIKGAIVTTLVGALALAVLVAFQRPARRRGSAATEVATEAGQGDVTNVQSGPGR